MAEPFHRPHVANRHRHGTAFDATLGLVERTRSGDRAAFAQLYQLTLDAVTRYVTVRLCDRDRDAIGDLVHDAYCFALAEPTLISDDSVGSMLRLAAQAVTRHQWSTRRYIRAVYTIGEDQQTSPTPDSFAPTLLTASEQLTRVTFVHALAWLIPDQRRAVQLRHLDGYPAMPPLTRWAEPSTPSGSSNAPPCAGSNASSPRLPSIPLRSPNG